MNHDDNIRTENEGQTEIAVTSSITLDELQHLLEKHKINHTKFQKTIQDLHIEIKNNDCFLYVIEGTLVRMVRPVFVKVMYNGRILVNMKDVVLSRNNQERSRNSLLSEKMFPNETPLIASKRAIMEELLLSNEIVEESVIHVPNMDRTQTNKMESKSYEGLTSVYQKHLLVLEVKDDSPAMTYLGLPDYCDFQTTEITEHKTTQHFWSWVDDHVARSTVVGANFDKIF